jgi:hypothetical protein
MSKYFSDKPVWLEASAKISGLHGKELLLLWPHHEETTQLRVDTAEPNSPLRGMSFLLMSLGNQLT